MIDLIAKGEKVRRTNFDKVGEFMKAYGQEVKDSPEWPDWETRRLRLKLIQEEVEETELALRLENMHEVAKELCDVLYVVYGMGHAFGIDLDACFNRVHESNMSKLGPDGQPIYREDGKVLKGPGYFLANLYPVLGRYWELEDENDPVFRPGESSATEGADSEGV